MAEATMSDYIKGFDAGYDFLLQEVQRWANQYESNPDLEKLLEKLSYGSLAKHNDLDSVAARWSGVDGVRADRAVQDLGQGIKQ